MFSIKNMFGLHFSFVSLSTGRHCAHSLSTGKMERQTPYADNNGNPYADHNANAYAEQNSNPHAEQNANAYAIAQLQQIALQRMHQNAGASRFPGRPDSFVSAEEQMNMPPKAEEAWDQRPARVATPMSAHPHREVHRVPREVKKRVSRLQLRQGLGTKLLGNAVDNLMLNHVQHKK